MASPRLEKSNLSISVPAYVPYGALENGHGSLQSPSPSSKPERSPGSFSVAVNVIKSILGAASFALPWGFQEAGLVAATLITVVLGILSYETMRILVLSKQTIAQDYGRSLDYAAMVALVLGERWQLLIKIATTISCLGACTGYLIFLASLASQLFEGLRESMALLYVFPIVVLLSWIRNYGSMALLAFVGNVGFGLSLVSLVLDGLSKDQIDPLDTYTLFTPSFMTYVGPATFLFTIHYVVLPMEKEAEDNPRGFFFGLQAGMVISTVFNALLGAAGYMFYAHGPLMRDLNGSIASGCQQPVCESAIRNIGAGPLKSVVLACLMVELLATYILLLTPAREYIENTILQYVSAPQPSRNTQHWRRNALRTMLVGVTALIAAAFPHFGVTIGIVGGLTDSLQAYVLPPVLYVKLHRHELSAAQRLFYWSISGFGVGLMCYTVTNIVVDVVRAWNHFT